MGRFERPREGKGKRDSKDSFPKREGRGSRSFEGRPKGRRDSGREPNRFGRNKRDVEMTKVTCSSCGSKCEVPFKPTSSKPVFCSDCFSKKDKSGSQKGTDKYSGKEFEIINEKLNKIMKALEIK